MRLPFGWGHLLWHWPVQIEKWDSKEREVTLWLRGLHWGWGRPWPNYDDEAYLESRGLKVPLRPVFRSWDFGWPRTSHQHHAGFLQGINRHVALTDKRRSTIYAVHYRTAQAAQSPACRLPELENDAGPNSHH